jgi:hypothetical protein
MTSEVIIAVIARSRPRSPFTLAVLLMKLVSVLRARKQAKRKDDGRRTA